jgi:hypothetical protein
MVTIHHATRAAASRLLTKHSIPALTRRTLLALLVALTLVFQTALAERHFEPIVGGLVTTLVNGNGTTPVAPLTGVPDDDCALCQFLALGIATDVPHDSIDWLRAAAEDKPLASFAHSKPRQQSRGSHQARAPPSPTLA